MSSGAKRVDNCGQVAPMCPPMWAHWRHLANTTEQSVCDGDAVLCQITLTTCLNSVSTCIIWRRVSSPHMSSIRNICWLM